MTMIRWDPARDLMTLRQAMDKLFEESVIHPSSSFSFAVGGGNIPVDGYQTADAVMVKAAIPGVKPEEVDISITGDQLTIKAEKKEEKEVKGKDYLRKENYYGMVTRSVTLPVEVNTDKAEASFDNGVLNLKLPKAETAKPKTIKIQTTAK